MLRKPPTLTVEVSPEYAFWAYGDTKLEAGTHEVDVKGDPELRQAILDAADAGVGVRVVG